MKRRGMSLVLAIAAVAALSILPGTAHPSEPIRVGVGTADITWHVGPSLPGGLTDNAPDVAGQDVPADLFRFAGLHTRPKAKAVVGDAGDLLLERTYRLLDDGSFAPGESDGGYDEVGSSLLIRWDEIAELEFFPADRSF